MSLQRSFSIDSELLTCLRGERHHRSLILIGAAVLLALVMVGLSPQPTFANSIVVSGTCDLSEAMGNANDAATGQPNTDCAAGDPTGADTIELDGDVSLTAVNNSTFGPTGLPVIASTIMIEGNGHSISRQSSAPYFRILAVDTGGKLTLNSITVSGGYFDGSNPGDLGGGGIYNKGTLMVKGSTLSGNTASEYGGGGAIRNDSSGTLTVRNSTLSGNLGGSGGGIRNAGGTVTVADSIISANNGNSGGGIVSDGTLTLQNSIISGNRVAGWGGGIYQYVPGYATVQDTIISDNRAGQAGGIYNDALSTMTVVSSTFTGNGSRSGGGAAAGAIKNSGTMTVSNSTLVGNWTDGGGGAILCIGGGGPVYATLLLQNSTISGNSALSYGGGLQLECHATLLNNTIYGNSATRSGGGVYNGYELTLHHNLIAGNSAPQGSEAAREWNSGYPRTGYNLFGYSGENTATAITGFPPGPTDIFATSDSTNPTALADILETNLADNGGPTWTHALVLGSPAIDKVPSALCAASPVNGMDQRGAARNSDGDGISSSNECDIGAFEYMGSWPPSDVIVAVDPTTISENGSVVLAGSFLDSQASDTHTVTISWGDSSPPTVLNLAAGVTTIPSTTHVYLDNQPANAPYTVTALVTDLAGGSATGSTVAVVQNVAPTPSIASAPLSSPEGTAITLTASAVDPSPVDTAAGFTFTWNVTKNGEPFAAGSGANFSFTPDDDGAYLVWLSATDKDNESGPVSATISVTNVAPTPGIAGAPLSSPEGTAITLTASAVDPSPVDTTAGFTFAWNVTKNGEPFAAGSGANFSFTPDDNGAYLVSLSATDKDNQSGSTSVAISVTNVAPTATFVAPPTVNEGSSFTLTLTSPRDPSPVDTSAGFTYTLRCAAGSPAVGFSTTVCTTAPGFSGPITVTGKIQDKDGAFTEYSAVVTVVGSNQTLQEVRSDLASLLPTGDSKTDKIIQKAIKSLDRSLSPDLWNGGSRLTKKGLQVFEQSNQAVSELMKIANPPPAVTDAIKALVEVDRVLAQTAINDAIAANGSPKEIAKAQEEMTKAASEIAKGNYDKAIEHFKLAWQHAQSAVK